MHAGGGVYLMALPSRFARAWVGRRESGSAWADPASTDAGRRSAGLHVLERGAHELFQGEPARFNAMRPTLSRVTSGRSSSSAFIARVCRSMICAALPCAASAESFDRVSGSPRDGRERIAPRAVGNYRYVLGAAHAERTAINQCEANAARPSFDAAPSSRLSRVQIKVPACSRAEASKCEST